MAQQLANYIRTYRRTLGLSQEEVAFLIGASDKAAVSLHETSGQGPSLETLIAYEALFGASTRELYAGMHQKVEKEVKRRARTLARELEDAPATKANARKVEALSEILRPRQTTT